MQRNYPLGVPAATQSARCLPASIILVAGTNIFYPINKYFSSFQIFLCDSNATDVQTTCGHIAVRAVTPIKRGEEVTVQYRSDGYM